MGDNEIHFIAQQIETKKRLSSVAIWREMVAFFCHLHSGNDKFSKWKLTKDFRQLHFIAEMLFICLLSTNCRHYFN